MKFNQNLRWIHSPEFKRFLWNRTGSISSQSL